MHKTFFTRYDFYSRLFLVPKNGRSMPPVIDLRAFPDGKSHLSKDVAFTRRVYDKFKRLLPFCPGSQVFPKVPLLHLEGNMLPVQSSSIRPLFGPQNFYESFKTCCRIP